MTVCTLFSFGLSGIQDVFPVAASARSKILEDGCLDFRIAKDPEDPANVSIIMTYTTPEAQAAHRETEHFNRFVSECMPMLEDAPDGTKFFGRKLLDRIA